MERLEQLARKLRGELPGLELREEEPMRNHTTFRIGGPARLMALPFMAGAPEVEISVLPCGALRGHCYEKKRILAREA